MIKKLFISSIAFTGIVMSQDNSASVQETSVDSLMNDSTLIAANNVEEFVAKEKSGFNIGFTGSAGFVNGAYITNTPVGGSLVITTPFGYSSGSLDFTIVSQGSEASIRPGLVGRAQAPSLEESARLQDVTTIFARF